MFALSRALSSDVVCPDKPTKTLTKNPAIRWLRLDEVDGSRKRTAPCHLRTGIAAVTYTSWTSPRGQWSGYSVFHRDMGVGFVDTRGARRRTSVGLVVLLGFVSGVRSDFVVRFQIEVCPELKGASGDMCAIALARLPDACRFSRATGRST